MSKVDLRLDWCSHEAAKYAVEHWHYSRCMPKSKLVKIGVWEDGLFIGAVIFGVGATADLVKSYGLKATEGCELVRVALKQHVTPVTRIISIAIRMLRHKAPKLKLIVSFADPEHGHVGGIYQGGGWIYTGCSTASDEYLVNGKRWHGRAFRASKPSHLTTKQTLAQLDPNYKVIKGGVNTAISIRSMMRCVSKLSHSANPIPNARTKPKSEARRFQRRTGGAVPTRPLIPSDMGLTPERQA